MIIHPHIPKRKKRKPSAKQRELQASWKEILDKYQVNPNAMVSKRVVTPITIIRRDSLAHLPSVDTGRGLATKKASPVYTGDAMIGISVLHKSNGVPVFRQEDAIDISKMRRG